MKKVLSSLAVCMILASFVYAAGPDKQKFCCSMDSPKPCPQKDFFRMPLIGDAAPSFSAQTTQGAVNFPEDYKGRWVVLFSYPADFTPVSATELITFAAMANDFRAINTELVAFSSDSIYSHIAWIKKIQEIEYKGIKNAEVTFPIIADVNMEVAEKFGMVSPGGTGAVFIIDPASKIRCALYYPSSTGKNFYEIQRIVSALQKTDADNVSTPANWNPGEDVIVPAPVSLSEAKSRADSALAGEVKYFEWFLCSKPDLVKTEVTVQPEQQKEVVKNKKLKKEKKSKKSKKLKEDFQTEIIYIK